MIRIISFYSILLLSIDTLAQITLSDIIYVLENNHSDVEDYLMEKDFHYSNDSPQCSLYYGGLDEKYGKRVYKCTESVQWWLNSKQYTLLKHEVKQNYKFIETKNCILYFKNREGSLLSDSTVCHIFEGKKYLVKFLQPNISSFGVYPYRIHLEAK